MYFSTFFQTFIGLFSLFLCHSCSPNAKPNPDFDKDIDSSAITLQFVDTLKLQEGEIAENWQKTELGNGYYLAFPKEAKKETKKELTTYKIKQREYILFATVRDMSKEASFSKFRADKTAYYYSISNDLADALTLPDTKMEIVYKKSFVALSLYEGLESYFKAADSEIYCRTLIIDANLYSYAILFWQTPSPTLLQMKDRFFYSFGKDLKID